MDVPSLRTVPLATMVVLDPKPSGNAPEWVTSMVRFSSFESVRVKLERPTSHAVTTPLTFAATANAALYLGADVTFADVQADTGNIDPRAIEAVAGDRTRLIVAVDFAGHPADYHDLQQVTDTRGIGLLADAAHSLGAAYRGRPAGSLANASALSFHPLKPITTAVRTEAAQIMARIRGWLGRA